MSTSTATRNKVSTFNYLQGDPLLEASTLTGEFELCQPFNCVVIVVRTTSTDVIGRLMVDFSRDGETVVGTHQMRITDQHINKVLVCPVVGKYCRLRFTAVDIEDLRTTPVSNDFNALTVTTNFSSQPVVDYDYVVGKSIVRVQGYDSFTGQDRIMGYGAAVALASLSLPSTGGAIRVRNQSGTANSESGSGARTWLVVALDANYNEKFIKGPFCDSSANTYGSGSGYSPTSTASYIRVNEFSILTFGSAGCAASGSTLSVLLNNSGYTTVAALPTGNGQKYDMAFYTVPAGYTAKLQRAYISSSVTSVCNTRLGVVKAGTRQPQNVFYNVSNSQTAYVFTDSVHGTSGVPVAGPGDSVVVEVQSTNAGIFSAEVVLVLSSGAAV